MEILRKIIEFQSGQYFDALMQLKCIISFDEIVSKSLRSPYICINRIYRCFTIFDFRIHGRFGCIWAECFLFEFRFNFVLFLLYHMELSRRIWMANVSEKVWYLFFVMLLWVLRRKEKSKKHSIDWDKRWRFLLIDIWGLFHSYDITALPEGGPRQMCSTGTQAFFFCFFFNSVEKAVQTLTAAIIIDNYKV